MVRHQTTGREMRQGYFPAALESWQGVIPGGPGLAPELGTSGDVPAREPPKAGEATRTSGL